MPAKLAALHDAAVTRARRALAHPVTPPAAGALFGVVTTAVAASALGVDHETFNQVTQASVKLGAHAGIAVHHRTGPHAKESRAPHRVVPAAGDVLLTATGLDSDSTDHALEHLGHLLEGGWWLVKAQMGVYREQIVGAFRRKGD